MEFGHEESPWKFVEGETSNSKNSPIGFSFDEDEDNEDDEDEPQTNLPRAFSFNENEPQTTLPRAFSFNENEPQTTLPRAFSFNENESQTTLPRAFSFGDETNGDNTSPPASPRTSCVSAASFPIWPTSPQTSWRRSPMHVGPTQTPTRPQPLLYDCLASIHRGEGDIFCLTITGDVLFTGSSSSKIHAWKQPDCMEIGYIKATAGDIRAILACGDLLFTAHGDSRIRAWETPYVENFKSKKIATLPKRRRSFFSYHPKKNDLKHKDTISCLAYNKREKLLFSGSWDRTVRVWKVSEKTCIDSFTAHEGRVNGIVINQEDSCVFTCSSDGTVKIWRRVLRDSSHILTMVLKFQPSPINALALSLSPSGSFLYSGSSDGLINFWEKEKSSGRYNHVGFLQGHHFAVLCLMAVEDLILSGSEDATIRIWRREEGNSSFHASLAVIDGHHGPVKCLAAAVENRGRVKRLLVYSASLDQTLKVWRAKVYPSEKVNRDRYEDDDREITECGMSPMLSPSFRV